MTTTLSVSLLSIIFMVITLLICFFVPIGLLIYFRTKLKADFAPFFFGCLIFIVFALILESTLNRTLLLSTGSFGDTILKNPWLYALYGGLAAGIFEETGRLIYFKYILKSKLKSSNALMYGAGHGGIEAILLVGFTYINNIVFSLLINANNGNLKTILGANYDLLYNDVSKLGTIPSLDFLLGGFERLCAISLHLALSVLVFIAVTRVNKRYLYFLAVLLHAFVNFTTIVASYYVSTLMVELILIVIVIGVVILVRRQYLTIKQEEELTLVTINHTEYKEELTEVNVDEKLTYVEEVKEEVSEENEEVHEEAEEEIVEVVREEKQDEIEEVVEEKVEELTEVATEEKEEEIVEVVRDEKHEEIVEVVSDEITEEVSEEKLEEKLEE